MSKPWIVDALNPIVWNLPGHAAKKFYSFSRTEYSSVLDLILAAKLTDSDNRAAQYLRHLQDEFKHTNIFLARANKARKERGKKLFPHPDSDYEKLFEMLGEKQFLAFVHLGEKRGCMQFTSYASYFEKKGDHYTASMFRAVLEDEVHHMNYTLDLLVEVCGGKEEADIALKKARRWEMRRNWMRSGRAITSKLFFLITISIYPLFLPYKLLYLCLPARQAQTAWNRA